LRASPLLFALALLGACAGPEGETKPTVWKPVPLPPDLTGLAVRIHSDGTDVGREAASALGTELARTGLTVLADAQRPSELDLRLAVDLHSIGIAVEGVTTLSAEHDGGELHGQLGRNRNREGPRSTFRSHRLRFRWGLARYEVRFQPSE
jgi:hypothetical protein